MTQEEIWRFFSKINIPEDPNKCWEWDGQISLDGYGRFKLNKKPYIAHRLSYMIFNNRTEMNRYEFACHSCDNKSCVNPAHLWLGTPKQNTADMMLKKRDFQRNKTHCKRGHEFSIDNIYLYLGKRHCRKCRSYHSSKRNA